MDRSRPAEGSDDQKIAFRFIIQRSFIEDIFVSRIAEIHALIRNGIYYLNEYTDNESVQDGLTFKISKMES